MRSRVFLFAFVISQSVLHAQVKVVQPLPFVLHSPELTEYTKAQIDAGFEALPASDAIRFTFLHKDERKKGAKYSYILTQKRAEAVMKYLSSKQDRPESVEMFVEPYQKPKDFAEASNLSYKKFASCEGVCSVIAYKPARQFQRYSVNADNALLSKQASMTCILASKPNVIYGTEGTILEFPDNAFVYENGSPIKCDTVCIKLWEFYSMQDIISAGLSTTSNKNMLVTAGMVYLEATCNGKKLKLRPGQRTAVKMQAAQRDKRMQVFSGKRENGMVDWALQPNDPVYAGPDVTAEDNFEGEGSGEGDYFIMKVSKLGWINCDRFYEVKNKVNLLVKADTSMKNSVLLIFKGMRSVLPGYSYTSFTVEFSDVPAGEEVTVLAFRINEKTKRATVGMQDLKLGSEKQVNLTMTEMSMDDFKSRLAGF